MVPQLLELLRGHERSFGGKKFSKETVRKVVHVQQKAGEGEVKEVFDLLFYDWHKWRPIFPPVKRGYVEEGVAEAEARGRESTRRGANSPYSHVSPMPGLGLGRAQVSWWD